MTTETEHEPVKTEVEEECIPDCFDENSGDDDDPFFSTNGVSDNLISKTGEENDASTDFKQSRQNRKNKRRSSNEDLEDEDIVKENTNRKCTQTQTQKDALNNGQQQRVTIITINSEEKRPTRQATFQPKIKDEPYSGEEEDNNDDFADKDYHLNEKDNNPCPLPRTRKPREKARDSSKEEPLKTPKKDRTVSSQARAGRDSKRAAQVKSDNENEDRVTGSSCSMGSARRNKLAERTDEQREAIKAKRREHMRRRRAEQRDAMTPEQREEYLKHQREKKRMQRALERESTEGTGKVAPVKIEEIDKGKATKKKRGRGTQTSQNLEKGGNGSRASEIARRRKKFEGMTEEEREAIRAKRREETRLRRARKRESMTAEQLEAHLKEQRERKQMQRALARQSMTVEQREDAARKLREKKKAERAQLTPEQKKENAQKEIMQRIEKRALMTDEEKQTLRMKAYFQHLARMDRMSPEEKERRRQWSVEYQNRRKQKMTADDWERIKEKRRAFKEAMTPEQRERYWEKNREGNLRRYQRLKQDPERWAEFKQKRKIYKEKLAELKKNGGGEILKRSKRRPREQRTSTVKQKKTWGEGEEGGEKKRRFYTLKKYPDETLEQRAERMERQKIEKRHRENSSGSKHLNEIEKQLSNPELRQRRLIQQRLVWAKGNLRRRLVGEGASQEEIDKRLCELQQTYQPTYQFRPYKPRADNLKKKKLGAASNLPKRKQVKTKATMEREGRADSVVMPQNCTSKIPSDATSTATNITTTLSQLPPGPISIAVEYPSLACSPANTSTCSYVSAAAAETSMPVDYTTSESSQQHHVYHLQILQNDPYIRTPSQQFLNPANTTTYILQLPPSLLQTDHQQFYSLHQHPFDSVTFQESETVAAAADNNRVNYPHPNNQSNDISCHDNGDCANNRYDDDNNDHSPSESPGGCGDDDDDDGVVSKNLPARKTKRPPRSKAAIGTKRGTKSKIPGIICDECGVEYSLIREHKLRLHNPNYKDKKCQLCGEAFGNSKLWYKHFLQNHNTVEVKDKPHVCEFCGDEFRKMLGLRKHRYYQHGDGLKKENWFRCPVCPEEKLFKNDTSFHKHLKQAHPDYQRADGKVQSCYRCEQIFSDARLLCSHVEQQHPDSYFPCEYCGSCRFTKLGLNFHYGQCSKLDKAAKDKMKSEGKIGLDRRLLTCEFCESKVAVYTLDRHYWTGHNVREDSSFSCAECGKEFSKRQYWVVHLEEKHLHSFEQVREMARKLNAVNREGFVLKKVARKRGPMPGQKYKSRRKPGKCETVVLSEGEEEEENDEEEEGEEEDTVQKNIKEERRRKVVVVAEEDNESILSKAKAFEENEGFCEEDTYLSSE